MAISENSYGSVAEVQAFTRHLLDGQTNFNSTTRPMLTEVEGMIDRASAALNVALAGAGLDVPITQATAKLVCDEWATARVVTMVEMTRQSHGWDGAPFDPLPGLADSALRFAQESARAFKWLGCEVANAASEGLAFSGETESTDRADPVDTSLQQPRFKRGMFRKVMSNE